LIAKKYRDHPSTPLRINCGHIGIHAEVSQRINVFARMKRIKRIALWDERFFVFALRMQRAWFSYVCPKVKFEVRKKGDESTVWL